jgi:hypothetical protein
MDQKMTGCANFAAAVPETFLSAAAARSCYAEAATSQREAFFLRVDVKGDAPTVGTSGPCNACARMKGLEAEVIEVKGVKNVLLHLDMIQQTVAMEIEVSYLKLVD